MRRRSAERCLQRAGAKVMRAKYAFSSVCIWDRISLQEWAVHIWQECHMCCNITQEHEKCGQAREGGTPNNYDFNKVTFILSYRQKENLWHLFFSA